MNEKNIQFQKPSYIISSLQHKLKKTPYQSLKLKTAEIKSLQNKKYSPLKYHTNFTSPQKQQEQSNKPLLSQSNFFNYPIPVQDQNDQKKQTFRDFINKIEIYNQNHISKRNQTKSRQLMTPNESDSSIINQPFQINLKNSIISQKLDKQTLIDKKEKQQNSQTIQKPKNFKIHEKMNRSFYTRDYRRSKTQQEIQIQKIKHLQNKTDPDLQSNKNCSLQNSIFRKAITKLNQLNSSNNKLKRIDIRLVQNQHPGISSSAFKEFVQKDFQLQTSIKQIDNSQFSQKNSLELIKIQRKKSKIRIRFGSSLYNKNLQTICNSSSKNTFKKQLENFSTQSGTIFNKKRFKKSLNSQFCQNKILQAQNIFIQKRRLLPSAEIKNHQDLVKTKKQFFTLSNSFDRCKKRKIIIDEQPNKGENLNGWESNEQGLTNYKIQQFF